MIAGFLPSTVWKTNNQDGISLMSNKTPTLVKNHSFSEICLLHYYYYYHYPAKQIIFHQPRFLWNKGFSLTKPPFGVISAEVNIIWPELMYCSEMALMSSCFFLQVSTSLYLLLQTRNKPMAQSDQPHVLFRIFLQFLLQHLFLPIFASASWWAFFGNFCCVSFSF